MSLNYASLLHVLSQPISLFNSSASRQASRRWPHYISPPRRRQPAGSARARMHVLLQISWKSRPRTACLEPGRRDKYDEEVRLWLRNHPGRWLCEDQAEVFRFYYLCTLCMYNFTIHSAQEPHEGYCNCWPETDDSEWVSSFLMAHQHNSCSIIAVHVLEENVR